MKRIMKSKSRVLSAFLAVIMMLSAIPMTAFAAPASDIPAEMLDNDYLDALQYTGYDVQTLKNNGNIFKKYGSSLEGTGILSGISYGLGPSGLETTGGKPNLATWRANGLCCASYVSYVYYNYLPNVAGVDTSSVPQPDNPRSAGSYNTAANNWVSSGKAKRISFTQNSDGSNFKANEEIPIGSLVVFKSISDGTVAHVAVYAGEYNGTHFVTHVGNDRGPEISSIEGMSKGGYPEAVVQIVTPEFVGADGAIEVYKKDTDGNNLVGAVFQATKTDDSTKKFIIGPTNNKGYAKVDGVPYGTYKIVETKFPANYQSFDKTSWTVTVDKNNDGVATFNAVNEIIPGKCKIVKTSEDGVVDGISFRITGNGIDTTVKTKDGGQIVVDKLKPGVYEVTEIMEDRYNPQNTQRVTVVSGQTSTATFNNTLKRGSLQVIKSSEDNLVEGVKFHLYGTSLSGLAVDTYAVTDKNGVAKFENVLISGSANYTIEEVDTAIRYVVPEKQAAPIQWNKVTERNFVNILKKFTVTVTKSDVEKGHAQGDASLAGAKYGIYKGDQLIDTYFTDENGQFTSKEYICDNNWSIRELEPSEGYLLDGTSYHIGAEPKLYTVEHNQTANDVVEQVQKGNIAIIKHTDNGDTQIETPESGAAFEIYLKSAGSYEKASADEKDSIVCDDNGFAQTKMMPYGIYTVHQTSGGEGRELMPDFDVFIAKDGQTYRFLINNANFESYVKVVKVDAETGKVIPYAGAGFKILDPDGNVVTMSFTYPTPTTIDTFFTDANGALVTPQKLEYGKGYSLIEVQAPYGYVLDSTPQKFDVVAENAEDEGGVTIVKVNKPNMAQKGTISITKTGEVFFGVSVSGGEVDGTTLPIIYQPIYKEEGLAGAVYEITAAEDVITPDGTVRYSKGDIVDTVTTDKNGEAVSKELYLGKFEVKEIEAPYGMVLNEETHAVELVYAGQNVSVTETATSFHNERQKVELSLSKAMEVNELFGIGNNGEVMNVTFGLYAAEDIVSTSGTVIPADGLIEIVSMNEAGKATVKTDLPFGKYYIQEIATDKAYKLNDTKYPVTFSYEGQDIAVVKLAFNDGKDIENEMIYGSVSGMKVDENGQALGGALIGLFKSNDCEFTEENALMTVVSADDGSFSFENVPFGIWYVREIAQPESFVLNENIFEVNISEDKQVIEIEIVNEFIRGNISLTKVDKDYPDNKLSGAVFEVYEDTNNNGVFDEEDMLIGELTEEEIGVYTTNDLKYGQYFVRETKAPDGFKLDEGVYSVFIDTDGKTYFVENEAGVGFINTARVGSLKIVKTSSDGKVEGFSFRVTGANGYDKTFVTDKNGEIYIEGLRIGEYTVSEISDKASANYILPADKQATVMEDSTTVVEMHNEYRDTPKTGDESNVGLWIALAGVSALGIATSLVLGKKRRKDEE